MNREGQDTGKHSALRGRMKADVAIAGGGLTGLSVALWLSRAGLRVALAEAETIGYGASGSCCGIVTPCRGLQYAAMETKLGAAVTDAYAHTHMKAIQAIVELCTRHGLNFSIREAPGMIVVEKDHANRLHEEAEAMKRAGLSAREEVLDPKLFARQKGLQISQVYVLDASAYLQALVTQAEATGVQIFERSRVTAVETDAVYTEGGSIQAPYIVIATGYPIVNTPGWYFIRLEQRSISLIQLTGARGPNAVFFSEDGSSACRVCGQNAVVQTSGCFVGYRKGFQEDPAAPAWAKRLGMRKTGSGTSGIETYTPDGLAYIGPYSSKTPDLFVGTGYGGNGLVGSMMAAQAISARILGLPSDGYEIYSPSRGINGLAMPLQLGTRYMKGMFGGAETPRCSHMGCRLVYNPVSRLWECPCHGSRFDGIGRVVNAPAIHAAQLRGRK